MDSNAGIHRSDDGNEVSQIVSLWDSLCASVGCFRRRSGRRDAFNAGCSYTPIPYH